MESSIGPSSTAVPSANVTTQALAALRTRLAELQLPQIAHRGRAIILLEGLDGAGKKAALREIASAFDPCHFVVHSTENDRREADDGHWLARFWRQLPAAGHTAIFYRGWYRRVLDDRLLGRIPPESISRAFDEINEFEAQQRDYGTVLLKLYFDVSADVQQRRLEQRMLGPWHVRPRKEEAIRADDPAFVKALEEMRSATDTRWSPWLTIDGDDEEQASLATLEAITETWAKALPAQSPRLVASPGAS